MALMERIQKNLKKIGVLNTALIAVALALGVFSLATQALALKYVIGMLLWMVALVFGLVYIFKRYQKSAATYYKLFFAFLAVSLIADIIIGADFYTVAKSAPAWLLLTVKLTWLMLFAKLVCVLTLCFAKDFGKRRSLAIALIPLAISAVTMPVILAVGMEYFATPFAHLLLAFISCVFVVCKYADKEARGTK